MIIITDRQNILSQQYKLEKRLKVLLSDTATRNVEIPTLNDKVTVNYNSRIKKWFYYKDSPNEKKFTFFVGNWKTGGNRLPYSGSISISWTGNAAIAGVFAEKDGVVFLLHSGNMGGQAINDFFEKYKGEIINDIEGRDKRYAVVGNMNDPDIAEKVVHFFDFLDT